MSRPWGPPQGSFFKYGYLGVNLFFLVSGFVILLSAYNKNGTEFIISRVVRLYPAYWVCVSLTFIVTLCLGNSVNHVDFGQYLANLSMVQNYFGIKSIDGVYWTLLVELKFYFLIFLLLICRQISKVKYFLAIWLALTIVMSEFHIKYLGFFLFPEWSSYFIAGSIFYLIFKGEKSFYNFFIIAIAYLLSIHNAVGEIPHMEQYFKTEFSAFIIITAITICYFSFLMLSLKKTGIFNDRRFFVLGVLTYPLYLIHQNIGYIFFNLLYPYLNKYIILLIVLFVMMATAYVIHIFIEKKYSYLLRLLLIKVSNMLSKFVGVVHSRFVKLGGVWG